MFQEVKKGKNYQLSFRSWKRFVEEVALQEKEGVTRAACKRIITGLEHFLGGSSDD